MNSKQPKNKDFTKIMNELEEINDWFQNDDLDLDQALTKLKKGKELVEQAKKRLKKIENEFIEVSGEN